jgi:ABC-type polysaccharide/polyol phosphate transport system ATPase subunit
VSFFSLRPIKKTIGHDTTWDTAAPAPNLSAFSSSIANFSELGEYLDLPVRTYSSGMLLRLAFAISTCIEPDILIMDEMVTAGDAQFIQKAERRLHEIVGKANILALASHDLTIIENICNKVLWLDHGVIKRFGPTDIMLEAYRSLNVQAVEPARIGGMVAGLNEVSAAHP